MPTMFHVYLLRSIATPVKSYVGFTSLPVDERLTAHNAGSVPRWTSRPYPFIDGETAERTRGR